MITTRFRLICNGEIIALVYISEGHPRFPNCKVGTIIPVHRRGNWQNGDLETVFGNPSTDLFDHQITNERIINDLLILINLDATVRECQGFQSEVY